MRKGTPQVAKSAPEVAKKAPWWAHFGTAGLTFDAPRAVLGVPWRLFVHFQALFLTFYAKSIIFSAIF